MTSYTIFNAVLGLILVPAGHFLPSRQRRGLATALASRIGLLVVLISYPWDFFAIRNDAWRYPLDPGPTLYGVPINDLVFIWLCTYLTVRVLLWSDGRNRRAERHSKGKHTSEQNARKDGC